MGDAVHRWADGQGQEWACIAYNHGPMCRLCRPVDEVLGACLLHVEEGVMDVVAGPGGEFRFGLTEKGQGMADDLVTTMNMEDQFDED